MTSPLRGGPLRKVSRFLESGDGSAPVANLADCTPARMLSQCACVQALIEREVTHARQLISWADICERRPAARAAAEELEHIALALYPSLTLGQVFTETGLVFTFPLAARYMAQGGPSSPHNPALSDASLPSTDYIASLFAVHRVICLAKGLLSDVRAGRHKYAAHQLALLYQAVKSGRVRASEYQRRIEERFEDCKASSETGGAGGEPRLEPEIAAWLEMLLVDIIDGVAAASPQGISKTEPIIACLGALEQRALAGSSRDANGNALARVRRPEARREARETSHSQ